MGVAIPPFLNLILKLRNKMSEKTKRRGRPTKAEERAELLELREYKAKMEAQLSGKSEHVQENVEKIDNKEDHDEFEEIKISQDAYIKVVCLCPMTLNLSTLGGGKGKVKTFSGFGKVKRILYSDLVQIMDSHENFLNEGFFYIANKDVIRRHGLDEIYERILSKEKIDEILSGNIALDILVGTTNKQKEFISDLVIKKLLSGEEIDLNLVHRISDISGVKILEKVEEAKAYAAEPEEE